MRLRRSKKLISILATVVFIATMILPFGATALAASSYSVSNVKTLAPSVKGGPAVTGLGTITLDIASGSMTSAAVGSKVYLELPNDYVWAAATHNVIVDPDNALVQANVGMVINDNQLVLTINAVNQPLKTGTILLEGLQILVPSGAADGVVQITAVAPSSSVFSSGKIDFCKIGTSSVILAVEEAVTMGSDGDYVNLLIKEASAGAMAEDGTALKLTLPSGFKWSLSGGNANSIYWNGVPGVTGTDIMNRIDVSQNDGRDLIIDNSAPKILSGSYFKLKVKVIPDDMDANIGNIEVNVGGKSTYDPSSFVIGYYGDYGVKLESQDPTTITAGKYGQKVGKIVLSEELKGSLIPNRTLSLTLPTGAKWAKVPVLDNANSTTGGATNNFTATSSDARTIKYTMGSAATTDQAKLIFKNGEVITAADFTGELKVTAAGSMGITNEITLATVNPSVTASAAAANQTELKIGVVSQQIGDITIEESAKEIVETKTYEVGIAGGIVNEYTTYDYPGFVEIIAPMGVTFDRMPTITTEGNLKLDVTSQSAVLIGNKNVLKIPVKSTSTKAGKIVISGMKLNIDRTVAEGELKLWVAGTALIDDINYFSYDNKLFEPERYAASVVVATVVTPAPGEKSAVATFKIGENKYTVNEKEQAMDVASYIKDGRTFLPLRYVGMALGVAEQNIMWDDAAKTATLIKGDKVVQVKIGSKVMLINGIAINMDVAPEITNDRTMMPLSWIGQAFGASFTWNDATKTATMNL